MGLPKRQIWFIIGVETAGMVALAVWVLARMDQLTDPTSWVIALTIIAVGDVITALVLEHLAPTRIVVAPGETGPEFGEVVAGFGSELDGTVMVRGEQWRAKTAELRGLERGMRVRIVERAGLTLLVEPSGDSDA